ncbi:MAG: hypothetical protein R3228_13790 [Halioglobus sp.]|nr:hypothetical protein [Halioglobus sp.]
MDKQMSATEVVAQLEDGMTLDSQAGKGLYMGKNSMQTRGLVAQSWLQSNTPAGHVAPLMTRAGRY